MEMHTAEVEVAKRGRDVDEDQIDQAVEQLLQYHASLGTSPRGWLSALVSMPAESVAQAAQTAAAVVSHAVGADVVAVQAMTSEEFDAREGFEKIPELVGATEAAEMLGVSRQAVQQMASDGRLPSRTVGKSLVIPHAAVTALAQRRAEQQVRVVAPDSTCSDGGPHDWDPSPLELNVIGEGGTRIPDPVGDVEWRECRRCRSVSGWPVGSPAAGRA